MGALQAISSNMMALQRLKTTSSKLLELCSTGQ
jgi:hypothetical protein